MSSQQPKQSKSSEPRPARSAGGLRVIQGEGQRRPDEPLTSRDAVARVLMEAGADMLLRRISPQRAEEIERRVDRVLDLFDRVDDNPILMPVLRRHLDELETLMRETREKRPARRGG
ncbi:MAG TPA: hypothetical protein VK539_19150 [Myxococcaceae bacterium]|nr:hypothetical protein [Myxococcaceae bacterium]